MYLLYNVFMSSYNTKNRHKFLLQYHLIFVCKYRYSLLKNKLISDDIKKFSLEICDRYDVIIKYMETDKDHIHYMIEIPPALEISIIVKLIKSYTTYYIWKKHQSFLGKYYWKEKTFWTDGYFISSIGNVSESTLEKYIKNQG